MTQITASQEAATEAVLERRRERARALRACRVHERAFLKQLPKSGYSPYRAGLTLGLSSRTVWNMQNRPRVKKVIELFLQDALDEIGVSHASLVADLQEIKERCMQHRPVLDAQGNPVVVPLKDGTIAAAYVFDAKNAIAAAKELSELTKLAPAKRIEVVGSLDVSMSAKATRAVANRLEEINDPNEAAQLYQQLMYGRVN